jgi:hypothetical protein
MRALAAVLADAWRVAFDVARIERRLVERGCEQQRHTILRLDQFALDSCHGKLGTLLVSRTRDCRPGLRNRVNPAFLCVRRTERGAVVEPRAPVPFAVPGLAL